MTGRRLRHALYLLAERALTWAVSPYLRAHLLRALGASVGRNVRVYEARFFNLENGFRHLVLDDDVHIGTGCLIDLSDRVHVRHGAVLSPRVIVLTHSDAGAHHRSPLSGMFPARRAPVDIGAGSWVGANATLLCGVAIGSQAVVAAGAVVTAQVPSLTVVGGVPAERLRDLTDEDFPPRFAPKGR
ncbi:MAG TPA: DapH/DapD/GlmU-related protein [Nitriliruptorales bacterium]|nr:DapH/DapD/GlmU-related protein [Nitriliruptorales bacterium]